MIPHEWKCCAIMWILILVNETSGKLFKTTASPDITTIIGRSNSRSSLLPYSRHESKVMKGNIDDENASNLLSKKDEKLFLMDKQIASKEIYQKGDVQMMEKNTSFDDSLGLTFNNQTVSSLVEKARELSLLYSPTNRIGREVKNYFLVPRNFTLGYLTGSDRRVNDQQYMRPGLQISGAITLAVNEINEKHPLIYGHQLNFIVAETYGNELDSILQTSNLWLANISAYIGPQETCVHEARMAAAFNLPMLSYFCTDPPTSNKEMFPTFARTRPPDTQISKSVASLLKRFNWNKVTFLYNDSPDDDFRPIAKTIISTLVNNNITVVSTRVWNSTYYHAYMDSNIFVNILKDTSENCRIYVALGFSYEFLGIMSTMEEQGLFSNGEYFVVGVMLKEYNRAKPERYLQDFLSEKTNATIQRAFQNFLGVIPTAPVGSEKFNGDVDYYLGLPPFNYPNAVEYLGGIKMIRPEAAYLYDAVNLYAKALNESLLAGEDPFNGTLIIQRILGSTYRSARGYMVHMDQHGDAEGNYTLLARFPLFPSANEFGLYPVGDFRYSEDYSGLPELHLTREILWKLGHLPIDEPECGFHREKCISTPINVITGVIGGVILSLLLILLIAFRQWKYQQELDSLLWKIDYREVLANDYYPPNNNLQGMEKLSRNLCSSFRTSQVSLNSNMEIDTKGSSVYTKTGFYKGRLVAVKQVPCKTVLVTRKVKKELKTMRDLRHDNLLGFVGACLDPPNVCFLTEYCTRGSLKNILANEDVRLDNMFIASLIGDIVKGMIFLHDSPIKFHGNLKTSNCLVDSRWVVKIADFGLPILKASFTGVESDPTRSTYDLLFMAPEILRNDSATMTAGTQKGDVYSFAIILYEVHGRNGPYGISELSPSTIAHWVIQGNKNDEVPFRPPLSDLENCLDCVKSCLTECWAENAEERPDFRLIRQILRPMRKGLKPNIFDNMLEMMEKYANNLEALVDQRTDLLREEKKKTDALLYEMLPRVVAEQLKKGHRVEAENFDCVTIYFSDIVGFTEMSAQSTAMQIVDFLNDLYTCFDSIIGNYDVYKIETIGDAYMVVSGLPLRNGDAHTSEIASMSLHLLDSIEKFEIRHRPNDTLKLRIGIHSGPVCAGVVGVKMPRYCLFGDTVNTASRMESLGTPLRIHCSQTFYDILSNVGGYLWEERGAISVKGKGEMQTYWLTGEYPEKHFRREWKRAHQNMDENLKPNGDLRRSMRGSKGELANSSLASQKKLRFVKSDELPIHIFPYNSMDVKDHSPSTLHINRNFDIFADNRKRNSLPCPTDESLNINHSFSSSIINHLMSKEVPSSRDSNSKPSTLLFPAYHSELNRNKVYDNILVPKITKTSASPGPLIRAKAFDKPQWRNRSLRSVGSHEKEVLDSEPIKWLNLKSLSVEESSPLLKSDTNTKGLSDKKGKCDSVTPV